MADELDAALVERCCKARWRTVCKELDLTTEAAVYVSGDDWAQFKSDVIETLLATGIPAAALNALARGEATVVPKEATDEMIEVAGPDGWHDYPVMLAASPYAAPIPTPSKSDSNDPR